MGTSFKDKPWSHRVNQLGDQAETVFEQTYPQGWARYGFNRPPINVAMVPEFVRFTPDYVTAKGLVEVQGFGRDQTFKLKHNKWAALQVWHDMFRTDLFVFDSTNSRYGFIRMVDMQDLLEHGRIPELQFENDGNRYWAVPADALPVVEWLEYAPNAT